MRAFFKWLGARWKAGLRDAVPLVIVFYLGKIIFDFLRSITINWWNEPVLDFLASTVFWLVFIPIALAIVLSWNWFRQLMRILLGKIPIVSIFSEFYFKKRNNWLLEDKNITTGEVESFPGSRRWFDCFVVKVFKDHENRSDPTTPIIDWAQVLVPAYPIAAHGNATKVPLKEVLPCKKTVSELFWEISGGHLQ